MDTQKLNIAMTRFAEAQPDAAMALLRLVRDEVMDDTAKHPVEDFTCYGLFRKMDQAQDAEAALAVGAELMAVANTLFASTTIPFAWAHSAAVAEKTMNALLAKGIGGNDIYEAVPALGVYRDMRQAANVY